MGNGQAIFDSSLNRYFIDLGITAIYDAASVGELVRWQRCFEHISQILFDLTSGQMQLGTLSFLNNGPIGSTDDIFLHLLTEGSVTYPPIEKPFHTSVRLGHGAMQEPLRAVHEFGHYLATLRDEYSGSKRQCQNDPSTHECIMEFAKGFGLKLDDDGDPLPASQQPLNMVRQFCFQNHVASTKNPQSCWETLKAVYEELALPDGSESSLTMNAIQIVHRIPTARYALAIPASDWFTSPKVESAIKNAVKEWVQRLAVANDELALFIGSRGIIHQMGTVGQEDFEQLLKEVDAAELAKNDDASWIQSATDQFPNALGAFQRLIVLAPGNSTVDLTPLAQVLPAKRISLVSRIYGIGAFTERLGALSQLRIGAVSQLRQWMSYQTFPIANEDRERFAFSLQNECIELFFASTPGLGIADMLLGRLPATHQSKFPDAEEVDGLIAINLEQRAEGVDVPVWIEDGARSVTFLLSQSEPNGIDFSLIAPNGERHKADQRSGPNVLSFDASEKITGRWILRLRRRKAKVELPFFLLSAVRNHSVATTASVEVAANVAKFRFQSEHDFPLDFMDTIVEIFRLLPDDEAPGQVDAIIVLKRETALDPSSGKMVELSTGWYIGEIRLEPGSYIAIVRASHHGRAIYASNSEGIVDGNLVTNKLRPIPTFARIEKHRFQVPK